MYSHPILNALFNENACNPSKQLSAVRELFSQSKLRSPTILLILPPAHLINTEIEIQNLFHDYYLLSHVVDASKICDEEVADTLNGSQWQLKLGRNQIEPSRGFVPATSNVVQITSTYIWSPGLRNLPHDTAFFIAEIDTLLVTNDVTKRFNWFGNARSTPQPLSAQPLSAQPRSPDSVSTSSPTQLPNSSGEHEESSLANLAARRSRIRNPASELGRTKNQKEQNMAKVDYCLACLQQDVVSSSELAERFHRAVTAVRSTLIEAGALYVESADFDASAEDASGNYHAAAAAAAAQSLPPTSFTLSQIYDYAEARLGKHLLTQLDRLLEIERADQPSFASLHEELRTLDLVQMDIPQLANADIGEFENAVNDAARIIDRLCTARTSHDMCSVFLSTLKRLANPALGTVSADTLLGLFMLTILRSSADTADKLELYLYFVTHFSFRASDTVALKASAGRVSYTLMVVESVLLQLRMEHERLAKLANFNKQLWSAIRGDDRDAIQKIAKESPTSLKTRRSGKSVLFMATEDQNSGLVEFLLATFPQVFTRENVLKDADSQKCTLLMAAANHEPTFRVILNFLSGQNGFDYKLTAPDLLQYLNRTNKRGRNLAFYLPASQLTTWLAPYLNWALKDLGGETPILANAETHDFHFFCEFCANFFDHIDKDGNSLLHIAARRELIETVRLLLQRESCDVNLVNKRGESPLTVATAATSTSAAAKSASASSSAASASASAEEVVELLLKNGADPWLVRNESSPAIRAARVQGNQPYVSAVSVDELAVYYPANSQSGVVKSVTDFVALSTSLQSMSPNSWIPPLGYSYPEKYNGTDFSRNFVYEMTVSEMQRQSFWLRQLFAHETFKNLSVVHEFCVVQPQHDQQHEQGKPVAEDGSTQLDEPVNATGSSGATAGSLFGSEDEPSVVAFMQLGSEHISEVVAGLTKVIKSMSLLNSLQKEDERMSVRAGSRLQKLASELGVRYNTTTTYRPSLTTLMIETILNETVVYARDLQRKLQVSLKLANELSHARSEVDDNRDRLRLLAEGKLKVSWMGNAEDKRVAEIERLESAITQGKRMVHSLSSEIRTSHYFLANELSSFNESQESELLNQIKSFSYNEMIKCKSAMKKLKYGCKF